MIDPAVTHNVDIIVEVAPEGECRDRQSIVMVRNVMVFGLDGDHDWESPDYIHEWGDGVYLVGALNHVAFHNRVMQKQSPKGAARANMGDEGTMHAFGTRVELDGVTTTAYKANSCVPELMLRTMVASLAEVGCHYFPQVYALIRDTEQDSGMMPIAPIDGINGRHVGCTVDSSVNLGNSTHRDAHDASPGYTLWLEETPGMGGNWFFVMPNLYGKRPDGTTFCGIVIKLGHGVAISWDGRVIRHGTSLSKPDGLDGERVGVGKSFKNHLYGNFTAAKERIVSAGRAMCAQVESAKPAAAVFDDLQHPPGCSVVGRKKVRKRRKNKKRGKRVKAVIEVEQDGILQLANELWGDSSEEVDSEDDEVDSEDDEDTVPTACQRITVVDIDVGGSYTIPRRRRGG